MKLGFEQQYSDLKFYIDAIGANPTIRNYKFSSNLDFNDDGTEAMCHKLKWTGQDKISTGPLGAFSPMDTDVKCDLDTNSNRGLSPSTCDAWKTYGGNMGFKWQNCSIAKLVALVALCFTLCQASSLPVDQIVDSLQSFLTAPEVASSGSGGPPPASGTRSSTWSLKGLSSSSSTTTPPTP